MSPPMAHLEGWLWTVYLAPALIVLVPIAKGRVDHLKSKRSTGAKAEKKRRAR